MNNYYSNEKNIQLLISLLKAHNIKKIIASPGTTNISFIGSVQNDSFFEIYSCVDERSACYMACGLAAESNEPVILSCTGATASRNYLPGLTEAFYRKLPILAITSAFHQANLDNNIPQYIDRSVLPKDTVKLSVQVPIINDSFDEWQCEVAINKAILELKHNGGGPVHINLINKGGQGFDTKELPKARKIEKYTYQDEFPNLPKGKIGIFIGAHKKFNDKLIKEIDEFCEKSDAIILCDHTSNYHGKYRILANIICNQESYTSPLNNFDLIIHIGDISGSYMKVKTKEVWRVDPDGKIKDTFRKLKFVFEMEEIIFFQKYNCIIKTKSKNEFYKLWKNEYMEIQNRISTCELPFSNIWVAQNTIDKLPENSALHLAILNSLRSWNFFDSNKKIYGYSNTGGFGIDGIVSSLIGASLVDREKIYFGVVGDLAFFYDLNSIGNKNIKNNIRLMVINNGGGTEFHIHISPGFEFGEKVKDFIAADGHFGDKSKSLIKHYAQDLGFEYISAQNKEEFLNNVNYFTSTNKHEKPLIFEIFTNDENEDLALKEILNLTTSLLDKVKVELKSTLNAKTKSKLKKLIKK